MTKSHWRSVAFLAVAVSMTIGAAGSSASTSTPARTMLDPLTVNINSPNANFAPVFIAKAAGIFEKYGLDVKIIENTGASTLNVLVSGQSDLTLFAVPNVFLLASQGQSTTTIMAGLKDSASALIGGPGFNSIADLRALGSNCHISTSSPGTQTYGYAFKYTKLAKLGLQQCKLEPASSNAVIVARLSSGQAQAAVLSLAFAVTFVNSVGAHILISPNKTGFRKEYGLPSFLSSVYFGLTSTVKEKRPQMVRFLKAINETNKLLVPKNLTKLTQYLQQFDSFKAVEFKSLRTGLQYVISYMGVGANFASPAAVKAHPKWLSTNPGYISEKVWKVGLAQYATWGIANFNPSAPGNRYRERVDMSLLSQALGSKR
jgi:ABC-type nitrate/sulfonate/bicarbonate transport system substrate-binding protein